VPSLPRQQPFHEPVGTSPEDARIARRWLVTLLLIVVAVVAGGIALFRLTA
jgi:hypothetical protein